MYVKGEVLLQLFNKSMLIKIKVCLKMSYFVFVKNCKKSLFYFELLQTFSTCTFKINWIIIVICIGRRRRRWEGQVPPSSPLEINSGKFEIIRALNFSEDFFLETSLIL